MLPVFAETRVRTAAALTAVFLLTSAYYRVESTSVMSDAALNLVASLSPEQAKKARFAFTDDERLNWHFIPKPRNGLTIGEMTPAQRHLAQGLLSAGLSQRGYIKATTIM